MTAARSTSRCAAMLPALLLALALPATAAVLPAQVTAIEATEARGRTGTLRVGDRIALTVRDEPTLTDTFTVGAGPSLTLPQLGTLTLVGVRRDGIQAHLETALATILRDPVITASALVRVAVLGEVARPGYFMLHADALLSDAITEAGGPSPEADMSKAKLSRMGTVLTEGPRLRDSLASGRTLDELGMQAGDELQIPRKPDSERKLRMLGLLVAIPFTVFALTR